MRGWRARYEEEQIKSRQYDRNGPIKLKWQDRASLAAELFIDDALWAFVEWSEKRQQWCIEDSQGRYLTHAADLRGTADSKQGATELATAMIRDGRLPTPLEALQRWDAERERRQQRPSEIGGAKNGKSARSEAGRSRKRDGMPSGKNVSSSRSTRPWPRPSISVIRIYGAPIPSRHCGRDWRSGCTASSSTCRVTLSRRSR
jgi:hypothetical protein